MAQDFDAPPDGSAAAPAANGAFGACPRETSRAAFDWRGPHLARLERLARTGENGSLRRSRNAPRCAGMFDARALAAAEALSVIGPEPKRRWAASLEVLSMLARRIARGAPCVSSPVAKGAKPAAPIRNSKVMT